MDERTEHTGQENSEGITEEMLHKSAYEIQKEEEEKAYNKKKQNEMSDSIEESVQYWQENDDISPRMSENRYTLQQVLGLGESFDVNMREMVLGGKHVGLLMITGFAKDEILLEVLKD